MSQLDRLYDALEKADAAGNAEDARELAGYIRQHQAQQQPEPEANPYAEEYRAESSLGAFGLGAERALESTVEGVKDLWFRAGGDYGNNKDSLAALTETSRLKDEAFSASKEEYPIATTAGAITSEIAQFALPASKLAKIGGMTKKGRYGAAAVEGAVISGVGTAGTIEERLDSAASGAAMGTLGQAGGELAGAAYRKGVKTLRGGKASLESRMYGEQDALADLRVKQAQEDGGFTLDQADARTTPEGLADARAATASTELNDYQTFKAAQEVDISNKAESLVDNASGGSERFEKSAANDMLADAMNRVRNEEYGAASANYTKWLEAEGRDIPLNSSGLSGAVDDVLNDLKPSADATVNQVRSVLDKYGFFPKTQKVADGILDPTGASSSITKVVKAQKPLTAGNYEEMVKEINSLFTSGASKAQNKPITQVFELLKESQPSILKDTDGIPPAALKLGEVARNEWRRLSKEWSVNDVVDRMTSVDKYGEAKVKPFQAAQKLLHPDNSSQLQRIKSKLTLGKDTDNHKAWFAMAQTPILEALEAAGKKTSKVSVDGESLFDVKAFATRINKLDPKTQRILWGDKGSADIQKAIKAWELKGKQSNGRAINLGGAEASAKAASGLIVRMLAPAGRAGGTLLASTPIIKEAIDGFKSNRIDKSGATLAAGGQSRAMLKAREEAIKEELKTLFGRDNYKQFSTAVEYVVRTIARDEE